MLFNAKFFSEKRDQILLERVLKHPRNEITFLARMGFR
jgi:hypothetical protein